MISFVDSAHDILFNFVRAKDAICQVVNDERKRNDKYNVQIQQEKERELEEQEKQLTEKEQNLALKRLDTIVDRAMSFLKVSVIEVDTSEIEKLKTIFSMGTPSDFVLECLINYTHSYWGLTFLSEKVNDGSVLGILKAPLHPDVSQYVLVINDVKAAVERFIRSYAGPNTLTMADETAAHSLVMLGGNVWENWKTQIDSICPAFATDVTLTKGTLTASERKELNDLIPPMTGRDKVIELANKSDRWKSILSRSQYATIIDEYFSKKEAEELKNITAYTAFENVGKV